jgi:urease accessory protein
MPAAVPTATEALPDIRLLRLLQLVSPALPVGAFAYSQGLEWAVQAGWLTHARETAAWIEGLLAHSLAHFEVPVFSRLYAAWQQNQIETFEAWNRYLLAGRGSAELQQEERHMGQALQRLLLQLQPEGRIAEACGRPTFIAMFAAAACNWGIAVQPACSGLLWSWCENQVAAAVKLVPLGQTDGQRILMRLAEVIPGAVRQGLALPDQAMGAAAPGLSMACALHETQHTRLFRS